MKEYYLLPKTSRAYDKFLRFLNWSRTLNEESFMCNIPFEYQKITAYAKYEADGTKIKFISSL